MMRRATLGLAVAFACSPSTRLVPTGPHPPHVQDFVLVPYPPPPAEVEEISYRSEDDRCFWVDGHYLLEGRSWAWTKGRWVMPEDGCYYAKSVLAWSKEGEPRLYYTPPRWYRDDASSLAEDRAVCPEPKACR